MKLTTRIVLLNGAAVLAAMAVLALGMGFLQARTDAQAARVETENTGAVVAAALGSANLLERPEALAALLVDAGKGKSVMGQDARHAGGPGREITVTDASGRVLGSNSNRAQGSVMSGGGGPIPQAASSGEPVMFRTSGVSGMRTYCAVPVDGPGAATVVVVEHLKTGPGGMSGSFVGIVIGFSVLALLAAGVVLLAEAAVLRKWVAAPLGRLGAALEGLQRGDFSTRLSGSHAPELAATVASFNQTAETLEEMSARQRELELALDGVRWGLLLVDSSLVVQWASRSAGALLRRPVAELTGLGLAYLVSSPAVLERARGDSGEAPLGEWSDEWVDGEQESTARWITLNGFPLERDDGALLGYAVVVDDQSANRVRREEQHRLITSLSQTNRMNSGLLHLLAGDFGARMGAAVGQDWELREMLALISELNEIGESYLRAVMHECALADVVERAIQSRAVLAASRGANVQVAADDLEVLADSDGLQRCIGHMLGAAIYAGTGPLRIRVAASGERIGQRQAQVEVEVVRHRLSDDDVEDLTSGPIDESAIAVGPDAFGLSLYLAARYARVMRSGLTVEKGEEGAMVLSLGIPLSPMAAAIRERLTTRDEVLSSGVVDGLTGLVTRPVFERAVSEEVHRCGRLKRTFALLLVDVQGLEQVGRDFGAASVDRVVRDVADILRRNLGKNDLGARVRGNAFMILMPETSPSVAEGAAEKLRWSLGRHMSSTTGNHLIGSVEVSVAMASYPADGDSTRSLISAAEVALADEKVDRSEGRDGGAAAREAPD